MPHISALTLNIKKNKNKRVRKIFLKAAVSWMTLQDVLVLISNAYVYQGEEEGTLAELPDLMPAWDND